jgi:hypothetical protein
MKYVHRQRLSNGSIALYFRRAKGRRLRLPNDVGSPEFAAAYAAALDTPAPLADPTTRRPLKAELVVQKIERALINGIRCARQRARRKGLPCTITVDWVLDRVRTAGYCCEATGLPFYSQRFGTRASRPSLDRIDNSRGYEPDNVRIVLLALNVMMSNWGEAVVKTIARSLVLRQSVVTRENLLGTPSRPHRGLQALAQKINDGFPTLKRRTGTNGGR